MGATKTEAGSWPTAADYERVEAALSKACNALDEFNVHTLRALDSDGELREGYPPPTAADIGRLSMLIERVDLDLRSMRDDLERLEEQRNTATFGDVPYA